MHGAGAWGLCSLDQGGTTIQHKDVTEVNVRNEERESERNLPYDHVAVFA